MLKDVIRHTRLAEFNLLYAGLLLTSLALTAVGLLGDRMELGMQIRTSAILGADGLIDSTRPLDASYADLAQEFDLEVAHSVSFMSMAITESGSRLAGVRAVSSNYPLRGEVVLGTVGVNDAGQAVSFAPARGTVWAATQLANDLNLESTPDVQIGDSVFHFERIILLEPEGGAGMFRLAPRVLMHIDDLDETGLITPASRAHFRLLVAGSKESLSAFAQAIQPRLNSYESWYDADLRREEVRNTIGRIISYVRLAVLLTVVLALVAMALAAQGLWGQQVHEIALLRCLGQKHKQTLGSLTQVYLFAAIPVLLLGIGLGYLLHHIAVALLQNASGIALPSPTMIPILLSFLICIVALVAVMIPILLSIKRVPVMTLLWVEPVDNFRRNRIAIISIFALIMVVTIFLAREPLLAFGVLIGFILCAAMLWLVLRTVIGATTKLFTARSAAWYTALKAIRSNSGRSAWLASAFGATLFALVLLGGVRSDLYIAWQKSVPPDAPNLFLINIKQKDTEALSSLLETANIQDVKLYTVIRSRIAAINGKDVATQRFANENASHRINHDFNLTELTKLPADNRIIAGNWFKPGETGFSLEQETAELLGLALGDRLTVDTAGLQYEAPITSLREVEWGNMQPNFYLIASPGLLDHAPRNFMAGIFVNDRKNELVHQINQSYPDITAIDLGMLLARFRNLSKQGSDTVSVIFVFTLIAAMLVLFGVLQGQRNARQREIALLKTLGAGRKFVRRCVIFEFAFLGALAGFIGGGLALFSGWLLAQYVFEFTYHVPFRWLGLSITGSVIVVVATGYASVRSLMGVLPIKLLARADGNYKLSV